MSTVLTLRYCCLNHLALRSVSPFTLHLAYFSMHNSFCAVKMRNFTSGMRRNIFGSTVKTCYNLVSAKRVGKAGFSGVDKKKDNNDLKNQVPLGKGGTNMYPFEYRFRLG